MKHLDTFTTVITALFAGFIAGVLIRSINCNKQSEPKNPAAVDSLITVNDSIKIKVEKLDSIKNAKVIEVQTLNNDSTLKLFYELVSE